jgi:hypothetical protein
LESPDLPASELEILEGDIWLLLRNVNTREGLAKGRGCVAKEMGDRTIVGDFDDECMFLFGSIRMDKPCHILCALVIRESSRT